MPSARPELSGLALADPPAVWQALGFAVNGTALRIGAVCLQLGVAGRGIVAWNLPAVDGLRSVRIPVGGSAPPSHPNRAIGVDHVVVLTGDFDRSAAALEDAGMALRRVAERPDGARMGFRRLGPAILELVEAGDAPAGPARFWGLVVVVENLQALAERLGDRLGEIKPAVQPGRRIATLRESAGLGEAIAFMDPER